MSDNVTEFTADNTQAVSQQEYEFGDYDPTDEQILSIEEEADMIRREGEALNLFEGIKDIEAFRRIDAVGKNPKSLLNRLEQIDFLTESIKSRSV